MIYRKAADCDYKEILKFEKRIFKKNFFSFLPKVYSQKKVCTDTHILCMNEKKICGAICIYPMRFVMGDFSLSVVGIGAVAVDKKYRGQGIMKKLMMMSDERAKELGADIGELSGWRKRYERYGYVPGGVEYVFEISKYNIDHYKLQEDYAFRYIKCGEEVSDFYYLYNNQKIRINRELKYFNETIQSWNNRTFSVIDSSGDIQGYIITSKDEKVIYDLIIKQPEKAQNIIFSYIHEKRANSLCVHLREHQTEIVEQFLSFTENYRIETAAMLKIFNYKSFIEKSMNYKLSCAELPEGTVKVKIDDTIYQITVALQKCEVTEIKSEYDVELNGVQAAILFTTYFNQNCNNSLLKSWLPFCPISISSADKV